MPNMEIGHDLFALGPEMGREAVDHDEVTFGCYPVDNPKNFSVLDWSLIEPG